MIEIDEIEDPDVKDSDEDDNCIVLGMDFGTTVSLAYYVDVASSEIINIPVDINNSDQDYYLLSSVVLSDDGKILEIGISYDNYCKKYPSRSTLYINSIKRLLDNKNHNNEMDVCGIKFFKTDNYAEFFIYLGDKTVNINVIEITSSILNIFKESAEKVSKKLCNRAVITVPAYFTEPAKQMIKMAADRIGLNVLRLLAEPTAAAISYKHCSNDNMISLIDSTQNNSFVVYDFGGGTYDISIMKFYEGLYRVLAVGGSPSIGGDDIDNEIYKLIVRKLESNGGSLELLDPQNINNISKELKENYYKYSEEFYNLSINGHSINITKNELESVILIVVNQTIDILKKTIEQSIVDIDAIKGMILVGGSILLPIIKEKIKNHFNFHVIDDIDPRSAVAMGAALQARNLCCKNPEKNNILLEVLPLSLGIETADGIFERVIIRNSPIPCASKEYFTVSDPNQGVINFSVYQGERDIAKYNRKIGDFALDVSNRKSAHPRIEVVFNVDVDGLLSISAKNVTDYGDNDEGAIYIEFNSMYGLDLQKEVDDILSDAIDNVEKDIETKRILSKKDKIFDDNFI